jgi:hypothetical protein
MINNFETKRKNTRHMAYIHPKTACTRNRVAWHTIVSGHCRATTQQNFIKNVCQRSF